MLSFSMCLGSIDYSVNLKYTLMYFPKSRLPAFSLTVLYDQNTK